MGQDKPLISAVMPVYNSADYVGAAIESILSQTYTHFELLVVDDGSTDHSRAVIESFAERDKRVVPIYAAHGGTSKALNAGVAAAAGPYIALLDSDDLALPERFAVQMDFIQRTGADVCGSCVKCFGNSDRIMWFPEGNAAIRSELLFRCAILPSTVLARAAVLKQYPSVPGVIFHEYELWTRLALQHQLRNVPQVLVQYRRHPRQTSRLKSAQVKNDQCRYGRRYFFDLFPEAKPEDFAVFERLACRQAHPTLADLELAGTWLLHVSDTADSFHRQRMADRWLQACRRSAGLGGGCVALYCRMASEFAEIEPRTVHQLWLLCLLRLGTTSRPYRWARQFLLRERGQDYASA